MVYRDRSGGYGWILWLWCGRLQSKREDYKSSAWAKAAAFRASQVLGVTIDEWRTVELKT
jgi:hypothetical protein